jgi:hypothetical protein
VDVGPFLIPTKEKYRSPLPNAQARKQSKFSFWEPTSFVIAKGNDL